MLLQSALLFAATAATDASQLQAGVATAANEVPLDSFLLPLITNMCMVVVVTYIITRMQSCINDVLKGMLTWKHQCFLILVFGLFSIYGTLSGIPVDKAGSAIANIRNLGPSIAGLIGGPWVGLGAGIIGGGHRLIQGFCSNPNFLSDGSFNTTIACSLATVGIGLAAGLVYHFNKRRFIGWQGAVLFMLLAETFHSGMVFLLTYLTTPQHLDAAWSLEVKIFAPMALATTGGIAVFSLIVQNLLREQKMRAERDQYMQAKERIDSELRVAAEIQMSMISKVFQTTPPRREYDLHARLLPAKEVGGDLYEFFLVDEHHLAFCVGDVSDKGVPAALFMAMTKTLLKGLAVSGQTPAALIEHVNRVVSDENEKLMFVTMFYGIIDLRTGELAYTNAGHNPPLLARKSGTVEWVKLPAGLVVGVDGAAKYQTRTAQLVPGDTLVVTTDGVSEAMSPEKQQFTTAKLHEIIGRIACQSAEKVVAEIFAAVGRHANGAPQSDDITVLVLRYNG